MSVDAIRWNSTYHPLLDAQDTLPNSLPKERSANPREIANTRKPLGRSFRKLEIKDSESMNCENRWFDSEFPSTREDVIGLHQTIEFLGNHRYHRCIQTNQTFNAYNCPILSQPNHSRSFSSISTQKSQLQEPYIQPTSPENTHKPQNRRHFTSQSPVTRPISGAARKSSWKPVKNEEYHEERGEAVRKSWKHLSVDCLTKGRSVRGPGPRLIRP